jgi:hypothetical protein
LKLTFGLLQLLARCYAIRPGNLLRRARHPSSNPSRSVRIAVQRATERVPSVQDRRCGLIFPAAGCRYSESTRFFTRDHHRRHGAARSCVNERRVRRELNPHRRGDGLIFLARHAPPQLVAVVNTVIVIDSDVKMLRTIPG